MALQTGSLMPAVQGRLRGKKRPGLTAGTAGGPWTSWGRLWSASPQVTPPPQTRARPLAKEAQDEDCQRAVDWEAWAITALESGAMIRSLPGLGWGSGKAEHALEQGLRRGELRFRALHCLSFPLNTHRQEDSRMGTRLVSAPNL